MRNCVPGLPVMETRHGAPANGFFSYRVKTTTNNKCSKFVLNYKVYYADIRDDTMYIMYIILHN